jgi:integrase
VDYLPDWEVHLRAKGSSRGTILSYLTVARALCIHLDKTGTRTDLHGTTRSTVDGEIERSAMETMSPPSVPEQPVPVLDLQQLSALLASCKGNTFENRRDTAIIRLFRDTGMRSGELIVLNLDDVDWEQSPSRWARAAAVAPARLGRGPRMPCANTCVLGARQRGDRGRW